MPKRRRKSKNRDRTQRAHVPGGVYSRGAEFPIQMDRAAGLGFMGSGGLFLLAYVLYAEVLRENVWLSRTVEVQENQKVVDTGLYGIVRHPMYMTTLLLFLSMPLVLGSVISFVIMLLYIPIIAKRIRNEEQVLEGGLEGYAEYKKRIRYKVIPFVW